MPSKVKGVLEDLAPIERVVKKILSPLRAEVAAILGTGKAKYDSKYGRFFQVKVAGAIYEAIAGELDLARFRGDSDDDLLPTGSGTVLKSLAEKFSRLLVAALEGKLHDDSLAGLGGYAAMLAGLVSDKEPEEILEQ